MKRALLSTGAALILAAAAFATPAAAQHHGGGGGGGAHMGGGGGGPHIGGGLRMGGGGGGPRMGGGPSFGTGLRAGGGNFNAIRSGNAGTFRSANINGRSWQGRQWQGGSPGSQFRVARFDHNGRHFRHIRRPVFAFGAPFYSDYGYYADDYYDDGCYQLQRVRTPVGWQLQRVYVCDY
jgi:hypothetical protein